MKRALIRSTNISTLFRLLSINEHTFEHSLVNGCSLDINISRYQMTANQVVLAKHLSVLLEHMFLQIVKVEALLVDTDGRVESELKMLSNCTNEECAKCVTCVAALFIRKPISFPFPAIILSSICKVIEIQKPDLSRTKKSDRWFSWIQIKNCQSAICKVTLAIEYSIKLVALTGDFQF